MKIIELTVPVQYMLNFGSFRLAVVLILTCCCTYFIIPAGFLIDNFHTTLSSAPLPLYQSPC